MIKIKKMTKIKRIAGILTLAGIIFFNGCSSYTPYEYESGREIKPGPGLFSGEDGVFTVYSKEDESEKKADEEKNIFEKTAADGQSVKE